MKTIQEMAREAGWDVHHAEFDTRIERFAALVREDERKSILGYVVKSHDVDGHCDIVLAADIRARSEK